MTFLLQDNVAIPLKTPMIAPMRIFGRRHRRRIVRRPLDRLRQRRQDLLALRGVESGNACRFGDCVAHKGRAHGRFQ
jgi:hypothetical protein